MKFSTDSTICILIGLFGIITGFLNKGLYLGWMTTWWQPSKDTQRFFSFLFGSIALVIGLALLRKINLH